MPDERPPSPNGDRITDTSASITISVFSYPKRRETPTYTEEPFNPLRSQPRRRRPRSGVLDEYLDGFDVDTLTELAIRLREPWHDGGPSYRTLADLFPYSRTWIGDRVREWRDGEHRELVKPPGPTVDDPSSDATALATDGGRRRRWNAYGTEGSTG